MCTCEEMDEQICSSISYTGRQPPRSTLETAEHGQQVSPDLAADMLGFIADTTRCWSPESGEKYIPSLTLTTIPTPA
jgi:hypothetical protein